jgi:hypothetical protein
MFCDQRVMIVAPGLLCPPRTDVGQTLKAVMDLRAILAQEDDRAQRIIVQFYSE